MNAMESDNRKKLLSEIIDDLTQKNRHDVTLTENIIFSYTWEIKNFQSYSSEYFLGQIESPNFEIGYKNISLQLSLHLNDKNLFYLSVRSPSRVDTYIHLTISIINKNEEVNTIIREKIDLSKNYFELCRKDLEKNLFDEKNGWLPNGNLIFKCVLLFPQNIVHNNLATFDEGINTLQHRLKEFEHFEQLLDTGKYSDVKLIIEDKEFQVHKCILTMFSPVFTAMFEHNMKEKNDNIVEITDIKYEVMKEVLRYIYMGQVNNFTILAKDILVAADKYEIKELKKLCEEKLISTLSNDNFEEIFILSDSYNANNLKKYVLKFMAVAAQDMIIKESSGNFIPESLIAEILMKILALKK